MLKRFAPALLSIGIAMPAVAQQDAHVHGVGAINIAVEKDELELEFKIPSESLVGFEWKPKTDAERKAIDDALALLRDPSKVLELPENAKCEVHEVEAEWEASDDHGHDDHGHDDHGHDDHGHDDHARHDDHDDHGHDDHAKHDEHDHDDHGHDDHDKAAHSEFHAHYHFDCEGAPIENIRLTLFETWTRIETIRLQALNENGQTGGNITASNPVIKLP